MRTHSPRIVAAVLAVFVVGFLSAGAPVRARVDLPEKLSDAEFWQLTLDLSEADGYFRSDNFLSNETTYQYVIPELVSRVKPGQVYMGVAPEINFTYIAALKPKMAFIVDIRRGNLHEHLLYKALFEMSADRPDFLSKLWSRKRPAGLTARSTVDELFAAYNGVQPTEELYKENLKAVIDWLTKTHEFKLKPDDPAGIEYVYKEAFYAGGPYLDYSYGSSSGMRGGNSPTYERLMRSNDGTGVNWSFLASDENFQWIKAFQSKNLLVPVVGDFGGPKAIRAVGAYVRERGATVGAFYLSNVEQYLTGAPWDAFCASVATVPIDDTSTYIFSGRGANGTAVYGGGAAFAFGGRGGGGGTSVSRIRPMLSETKSCTTR
jgi:hypothetical protein